MPESTIDLNACVRDFYDDHRLARFNAIYYGKRLKWYRQVNTAIEILIAVGTTGTVASLVVMKDVPWLLPALAAVSAILGVAKPFLHLSAHVERCTRLFLAYNDLFYATEETVREINKHRAISEKCFADRVAVSKRFRELATEDDAAPDAKLVEQIRKEVNRELPPERWWFPQPAGG